MHLSLLRIGPLAEALRPLLPSAPPAPDAPAVLADLIPLRGGVELADHLDRDFVRPPPVEPAIRGPRVAALRARVRGELGALQARLDEALGQAHRPRYRLPGAARAFAVLQSAGALDTRKGPPLKTALRTLLAPYHEFLETHLKRARFGVRDLRTEITSNLDGLGGEGAALAALEGAISHALQPRIEELFRRAQRAAEDHLARTTTALVQALPKEPAEADLAPAFEPEGAFTRAFAEARALVAALFSYERRWLEGLVEAAIAAE